MDKKVEIIWIYFDPELSAFIQKRVDAAAIADDILQEVFLKYMSSASTIKDPAKIRPWLYQVTRNQIADNIILT